MEQRFKIKDLLINFMALDKDCIFCKIVKGEVIQEKVFENDDFIVIKDINQSILGHSLVIPKKHYTNFDEMPTSDFEEFLKAAKEVVPKLLEENDCVGYNLLLNNHEVAGQVVPHVHLHIMPRKEGDGVRVIY